MDVFDATGRKVKTIHQGQLPAGAQYAFWDGTNYLGAKVENGLYYFTMKAANTVVTDKVILSR
jgi:flagellar hook assembly protein FlgD